MDATWAEGKDGEVTPLMAGSPLKKGRMSLGVTASDALVVPRKRTNANHLVTPKRRAKRVPLADIAPISRSPLKPLTPQRTDNPKRATSSNGNPTSESAKISQTTNQVETPEKQTSNTAENQALVVERGAATERPAQRRKSMRKSLRRLTADCTNFAVTFTGTTFDDAMPQAPTELVRNVEEHERQGTPSPVTPANNKLASDFLQKKLLSLQKERHSKESENASRPWKSVKATKFADVDDQEAANLDWLEDTLPGYRSSRWWKLKEDGTGAVGEASSIGRIDGEVLVLPTKSMTPIKEASPRKARQTPRSSKKTKTPLRGTLRGVQSTDAFVFTSVANPGTAEDQISLEDSSQGTIGFEQGPRPFEDMQPGVRTPKHGYERFKTGKLVAELGTESVEGCNIRPSTTFECELSLTRNKEPTHRSTAQLDDQTESQAVEDVRAVLIVQDSPFQAELLMSNISGAHAPTNVDQTLPEVKHQSTEDFNKEGGSVTDDGIVVEKDITSSTTEGHTPPNESEPCIIEEKSTPYNSAALGISQEVAFEAERGSNSSIVDVADKVAVEQEADSLGDFEINTLPKLIATLNSVQRDVTPESEELKESSTPDPTTNELVEVISENATATKYDEDDTDLLRNFLTRVKANKEARANATSTSRRKRSFPHSPMKLPLESGDDTLTFSPNALQDEFDIPPPTRSPTKRRRRNETPAVVEEESTDSQSVRRSGRTRLPIVKASAIPAPNFIRLGRLAQDDTTTLTFRRHEEKDLAALTRVNTRKNKGTACSAQDTILNLEDEEKNPARRHQALKQKFDAKSQNPSDQKQKKKSVVWAEEIAQYSDGKKPESKDKVASTEKEKVDDKEKDKKSALPVKVVTIGAPTGADEKKNKSVRVGVRSSRIAMGMSATGTPAPKRKSKSVRT